MKWTVSIPKKVKSCNLFDLIMPWRGIHHAQMVSSLKSVPTDSRGFHLNSLNNSKWPIVNSTVTERWKERKQWKRSWKKNWIQRNDSMAVYSIPVEEWICEFIAQYCNESSQNNLLGGAPHFVWLLWRADWVIKPEAGWSFVEQIEALLIQCGGSNSFVPQNNEMTCQKPWKANRIPY